MPSFAETLPGGSPKRAPTKYNFPSCTAMYSPRNGLGEQGVGIYNGVFFAPDPSVVSPRKLPLFCLTDTDTL